MSCKYNMQRMVNNIIEIYLVFRSELSKPSPDVLVHILFGGEHDVVTLLGMINCWVSESHFSDTEYKHYFRVRFGIA